MFPLGKAVTSWTLLLFTLIAQFEIGKSTEGRVVCYYTSWSVYRSGTAKFNPQNINPYLCTHLIYAFGGFTKDNALKTSDKYEDIDRGGYSTFNGLKTYNKELKTLLAIGGTNEGPIRFSSQVASPQRRQEFTKNIIKFLRQNHFDGLDLDWAYPSSKGGKPRDRENYAQFVQELREEFELESSKTGRSRLLLTMAVPARIEYIKKGYDVKKLNKYLDWFNLLSYDYHGSFAESVNHHAPLYSLQEESEYNNDTYLNIDFSIKYYLNEGADRNKLVLGIPTYGRSYTLLNENSTDIGAPTDGPGAPSDATKEKGALPYYEICQNIMEDPDWIVVQADPDKLGPYAFKDDQWVGYDDEGSARKKGEYVVANGLGGIMFWSIDYDDFLGLCHKRPYPIIEAAKEAMLNGLGLGDNEVVGPPNRGKPGRQRSRNTNKITTQTKDDEETISTKSDTSRRQQTSSRRPSATTERYEEVKKPVSRSTTEPPTPRTTTNEPETTSSKSHTTVASSRSTFLKRPSTTPNTRVIDEEEYIAVDDEDRKVLTGEVEEDPKILKELIDIIKKLGGLLEQLIMIRNSRPSPQNSVIEHQDETDIYQERPKYVTLNRKPQYTTNENDEKMIEYDDSDDKSAAFVYTTSQPQYVNIQRTRPVTTKSPADDITDEEVEVSTRRQYETLNRGKPFAVQNIDQESVTVTTNRYKTIQRTQLPETTEQPASDETPVFISQGQQIMVPDNDQVLTNTPDY